MEQKHKDGEAVDRGLPVTATRPHCLGVIEPVNCGGREGFKEERDLPLEALADFAAIALEKTPACQAHPRADHHRRLQDLYNARQMEIILETGNFIVRRAYGYRILLVCSSIRSRQERERYARPLVGFEAAPTWGQMVKTALQPD